jgi:hypothetical protein
MQAWKLSHQRLTFDTLNTLQLIMASAAGSPSLGLAGFDQQGYSQRKVWRFSCMNASATKVYTIGRFFELDSSPVSVFIPPTKKCRAKVEATDRSRCLGQIDDEITCILPSFTVSFVDLLALLPSPLSLTPMSDFELDALPAKKNTQWYHQFLY